MRSARPARGRRPQSLLRRLCQGRDRVARSVARSALPVSALEGLGRIHTGDPSVSGAGRWRRIERSVGEASGKPGIQLSRGFLEYGRTPDHFARAARQLDLLHEIGHHAEYLADVLPASQFAAGEARAENYAYAHAGGNKGQESFSAYDAGVTDARSGLRHRWGAAQARAYKAERAAGCLPGDPPAPVNAARFFEPDSFTAARGRRAARLSERGGERVPSLPGRDHADLEAG